MPEATVDQCPIADGGEGTVEALVNATSGHMQTTCVTGPLGAAVDAPWGWLGTSGTEGTNQPKTAVIELAAAAGLALVPPDQRNPTRTSTYGVGQLIYTALEQGAQRVLLGIGGSATNDAACGAAQALGARFFDANDQLIETAIAGSDLGRINRIDLTNLHPGLDALELIVACDVTNPLFGEQGAAYVYGPQKGATPAQIAALDQGLRHIAPLFESHHGEPIAAMPGAGAAGGFGGGAVALLGGRLEPGIQRVLEAVGFRARVANANLCLTGEGKLDVQSSSGKAISGVIEQARAQHVPVVALAGLIDADPGALRALGLSDWQAIGEGLSAEQAMRDADRLLELATVRCLERWRDNTNGA